MLDQLTPVQQTLFIPLAGRAFAQELFPQLNFNDPLAKEVILKSNYPYGALLKDKNSIWGSIQRTKVFDEEVIQFIKKHPGSQIMNMGCGLCTRAWRLKEYLKDKQIDWHEFDFESTITLKKSLFPNLSHLNYHPGNILDFKHSLLEQPVLFIFEGVLMFIPQPFLNQLLAKIHQLQNPHIEIIFDYIHPIIKSISGIHPSLKLSKAQYQSGLAPLSKNILTYQIKETDLFTRHYQGKIKLLNNFFKLLFGAPFYDVGKIKK